jgi:hypothetical protein
MLSRVDYVCFALLTPDRNDLVVGNGINFRCTECVLQPRKRHVSDSSRRHTAT